MRTIVIIGLAACVGACAAVQLQEVAQAGPESPQWKEARARVGKTYWSTSIAGLRFCDTPSGLGKCKYYEKGSFTVTGLAEDIGGDPAYAITTGTGENGYVPWTYAHEFVTEDPAKTKVKAAAECKRRGEPRIGMTAAQAIATCWGKPERVNRTQTGARTSDQYVYPGGRYLYFQNGVLTSMQVSGTLAR